ncbi:MAG: branched-chain amino acid ABC transporter permease [Aristaeellaceae bacterium]
MVALLERLLNGLSLGSLYAIIALGYTMVYGIAKMLNFAHGDVIMVGAYIAFYVMMDLGMPPLLAMVEAMALCTVLGIMIEKFAYKPLRQATSLAVLITAIGMSYLLQNGAQLIWGSQGKQFPDLIDMAPIPLLKGADGAILLSLSGETIVNVLTCVLIMVALTLFTSRTKMGKAMRVVSEDRGAAELMGIDVNATISLTFAIGSALAAIAGVLLCTNYQMITPTTGSMPGIKAFTAAVFGGIGSIPGAMLGGITLGIIEQLGKQYISTDLGDAIVFAVLIVVLLVKPTGLLGKKIHEKV